MINVFYFSQDVEYLLPLPLKPTQILSAKFIVALLYEYITTFIFIAPVLAVYGWKSGGGLVYILFAVLVFLTLPIIPLALASIIAMVIMRFTNIGKHKDRYRLIGGVVAIAFALGSNLFFQRFNRSDTSSAEELQDLLLSGNNSMVDLASDIFPAARFTTKALLQPNSIHGLTQLLIFLGLTFGLFAIFQLLGKSLYFKGVIGMSEASAKRVKLSDDQLDVMTKQQSAFMAYFKKECRMLIRTPSYFLNCVLICLLWPLILIGSFFTQRQELTLQWDAAFVNDFLGTGILLAIAAFLFFSGTNPAASTAFSREGQSIEVYRFLPVPYITFIMAKVIAATSLNVMSVFFILAAASAFLPLPWTAIVATAVAAIPAILFASMIGIIIDLWFPKLVWDSEQKAVKQNVNSLLAMLVNAITAGIVVFAAFQLQPNFHIAFWGAIIVFSSLSYGLYLFLKTKGSQRLQHIS